MKASKKKKFSKRYSKKNLHPEFISRSRLSDFFLFLFIALLPAQLGRHFFFPFSYISGLRVDYLAPTLYITDLLVLGLAFTNWSFFLRFLKNKFVATFLIVLLIHSVVFANVVPLALYRVIKILEIFFIFFLFRGKKPSHTLVLWGFLTGTALEVVLSVWQFVIKHSVQGFFYFFGERALSLSTPDIAKASLQGIEILRAYGTFSHPNSLAGFYLLMYVYVLTLKKTKYFWLKNSLLLGSSILIFLSFSKVAITLFLLVNFMYLIKKELVRDKKCWLCLLSQVLVFIVLGFVFMSAQTDPFSLLKRFSLIQNSFTVIKAHLFTGVGLGNYLVAQGAIKTPYFIVTPQPVHNIFLYILAEVGIVLAGAALYLLLKHLAKRVIFTYSLCLLVIIATGLVDHYWVTLQQNMLLAPVVFGLLES